MGRVFLARQAQPEREVALKLVRALDSQALARFRREAELLASLEHSGIARLYASGDTEIGGLRLPWLAMEYVPGLDLLRHADAQGLDLASRLRLLIAVCKAVHYAHGRGVIHRDLKPGNILVDAEGQPRVLDFGIARLLEQGQTMTQAGQVLGTLPYMSPEQLSGGKVHPDARGDVYALGVIAYELIAGRLPHPRLSTSTLIEALDIIRRETPPRLSSLAPRARGDLDWVVMKALASEPERRYSSAAEFAAELERVLDHRPVAARPPTVGYLLSRFVRRNRALSAALAMVALVLVGASVVSLRFAWSEAEARLLAERRAAEAQAVSDFLQTMLVSVDPENARGEEITLREVLDQSALDLERGLLPAEVAERMRLTSAEVYLRLGDTARAEQLIAPLQASTAAAGQATGNAAEVDFRVQAQALAAQVLIAKGEVAGAIEAYADILQQPLSLGIERRFLLEVEYAEALSKGGKHDQAVAALNAALSAVAGDAALPEAKRLAAQGKLAAVMYQQGDYAGSAALAETVLAEQTALLGEDHPDTLASLNHLAATHQALGDSARAAEMAQTVLDIRRKVYGASHPAVLDSQRNLAIIKVQSGQAEAAIPLLQEVIDGWEALRGKEAQPRLSAIQVLAYVLIDLGQAEAAERLLVEAVGIIDAQGGPKEINPLSISNELAMLLMNQGRYDESTREFERLFRWAEPLLGENDLYRAIFRGNYGQCLLQQGKTQQARASLESSWTVLTATLGAQHARAQKVGALLQQAYLSLGLSAEAERISAEMQAPPAPAS